MPPETKPQEPDELAFLEWARHNDPDWQIGLRPNKAVKQAFLAGWKAGNEEAYADMEKRHE